MPKQKHQLRIKLYKAVGSKATRWRKSVKEENPAKYHELKVKDAERKRAEYHELKEKRENGDRSARAKLKEKKLKQREVQKRYRERLKIRRQEENEAEATTSKSTPSSTQNEKSVSTLVVNKEKRPGRFTEVTEAKKEKQRKCMAAKRSSMTHQKKNKVKAIDRARKHDLKDLKNKRKRPYNRRSTPICSKPTTPNEYADHVSFLLESATPRKKRALEERHIEPSMKKRKLEKTLADGVKNVYRTTKNCSKESAKIVNLMDSSIISNIRKKNLARAAAKRLSINRHLVYRRHVQNRKRRIDTLSTDTREKVLSFYRSSEVSTERPELRFKGKRLMNMAILPAFNYFHKKNPGVSLGYTKFRMLRPKNVLVFKKYHFNCKCTYCNNVEILLRRINQLMGRFEVITKSEKAYMKLVSVYDLQKVVMCEKSAGCLFHSVYCIRKECKNCEDTDKQLRRHYKVLFEKIPNVIMKWDTWERDVVKANVRKDGEFVVEDRTRLVLNSKEGTFKEAFAALVNMWEHPCQGVDMRLHLLNASWQDGQYEKSKKLITPNIAIVVYDFARNFATMHQDEVKSSGFAKQQITLHPVPMYYMDPITEEIVRETLVITSDDITHDVAAVSAFRERVVSHLRNERKVLLKHLFEWSDGCGPQYKGVYAFKQITVDAETLNLKITASYYGSEHGKGESDGETGTVKSQLASYILGESVVIKRAADIKKIGDERMSRCAPSKFKHIGEIKTIRTFAVVNDISRNKREVEYYPIAGTRVRLHCIETTGNMNEIMVRNLSCFCHNCFDDTPSKCTNKDFTVPWESKTFKVKKSKVIQTKRKSVPKPPKKKQKTQRNVRVTNKVTKKKQKTQRNVQVTNKVTKVINKEQTVLEEPKGQKDKKEMNYEDVCIGQWVLVEYEGEKWVGKVTEKRGGMTAVQCLEKPFGINIPQDLEKENDIVFYETVYHTNVNPNLIKVNRGWKWVY